MNVCGTCGVVVSQHSWGWKHNNHPRSGVLSCKGVIVPVFVADRLPWTPKKRVWGNRKKRKPL